LRKAFTATLSAIALTLPYTGMAVAATKPKPKVKTTKSTVTKTYTGPAGTADRWGTVTVTITVAKTTTTTRTTVNGKTTTKTKSANRITNVSSQYEVHTDRSQFIMEQALPMLKQEVLQAQSANVQMIGHATNTSEAFIQSLQAAVSQMGQSSTTAA
jgi:uncharacterized protein with FMN-binding domain